MRIPAIVAAVLLLALAPAASASIWPAPAAKTTSGIRLLTVPHKRSSTRACARGSKAARWLAPVACEQPPRSEVLVLPLLGG
ncbi:MAG: hypothetical protein ACRDL2_09755 [Gaiellaceae bacterium]